jgi:hypothetical protein
LTFRRIVVVQYSGSSNPRAACPWCRRRRTLRKIGCQCHGVTFQKTWKLNNTAVRSSSLARVKYLRRNDNSSSISSSSSSNKEGKITGTHCIGGWVEPRTGMDGYGKSRPHRDSIPGPSGLYRVSIPSELSRPTVVVVVVEMFWYVTSFC